LTDAMSGDPNLFIVTHLPSAPSGRFSQLRQLFIG